MLYYVEAKTFSSFQHFVSDVSAAVVWGYDFCLPVFAVNFTYINQCYIVLCNSVLQTFSFPSTIVIDDLHHNIHVIFDLLSNSMTKFKFHPKFSTEYLVQVS